MSDTGKQVFDAFRRWGYLEARLDPFGRLKPLRLLELELEGEAAERARAVYCGPIGAEFMHIPDAERRAWVAEHMEAQGQPIEPEWLAGWLMRAEVFEQMLQRRYIGSKRYSLEGAAALIPCLLELLEASAPLGVESVVLGMSHRGRLNTIVHVIGRSAREIFARFEDTDPRAVLGSGDVKYHIGATGEHATRSGHKLRMSLVSNPSHLEAVDPIAMGRARAKQVRRGREGRRQVLPITIHGDAAFAGQGIAAETLNMAELEGYSVGGTIHVVVNNLIGFTTAPEALHSSRFATDVARRLAVPILHVDGEQPEAVVRVACMAAAFRHEFQADVVIDLIGFRRHGHSEVDDPTYTQPLLYKKLKEHPPLWQLYAERAGLDLEQEAEAYREELQKLQDEAQKLERSGRLYDLPAYWSGYHGGRYEKAGEVETGVDEARLEAIGARLGAVPEGFTLHPKLAKLLDKRLEMARGKEPLDYGMAEALAFGSLVTEGIGVRLSGEDTRRGTFSHRHAVLVDYETGGEHVPLSILTEDQAPFECYDSPLSEAAVLGYEYGVSRDAPDWLVLWEAQFGDFANGAQVIIDQFIAAAEDKWGLLSGVVLLLPHGWEGQGPEHSSARLERFLNLAAEDNLQVCQPSTAAQYFHLLRRQALRKWRKPLVVLTPKAMLRHPAASSTLGELAHGRFETVLGDPDVEQAKHLVVCSGKIAHEIRAARKERRLDDVAVITIEQLYPFPEDELDACFEAHEHLREIVWVQEEPANMGALGYVLPKLRRLEDVRVRPVMRSASASPATGSAKAHEIEQRRLIDLALGPGD